MRLERERGGGSKHLVALLALILLLPTSVSAAFNRPLSLGSTGPDVTELQTILKDKGFFNYPEVTGYYGQITLQAVADFQRSINLDPLGYVGPLTRAALNGLSIGTSTPSTHPASVLSLGSRGPEVGILQLFLQAMGFFTYPEITNYFGVITEASLKAFQAANSLITSGATDEPTRTEIMEQSALTGASMATSTATSTELRRHRSGGGSPSLAISNGVPSGALPYGTTSTALSVNTNRNADCRYSSSSGTVYESMTAFTVTGTTNHSSSISGLENAENYIYYVECRTDEASLVATSSITFSVSDFDINNFIVASFDFGTGEYVNNGNNLSLNEALTIERSNAKYALGANGSYEAFGANTPAIKDGILALDPVQTNLIRNSSFTGTTAGVIGSGGIMPTNTSLSWTGVTRTVVGTGTEYGLNYVDVQLNGTPSGTGFLNLETTTGVPVAPGNTLTTGAWIRLVNGSLTNVTAITMSVDENNSLGADVSPATSVTLVGLSRVSSTTAPLFVRKTIVNSSAAYAQPFIRLTGSGAIDLTLRIYQPQAHIRSVSSLFTAPISTSGTAVTHNESARLTVSNGTYDFLVEDEHEALWYRDQVVSSGFWPIPIQDLMNRSYRVQRVTGLTPLTNSERARAQIALNSASLFDARSMVEGQLLGPYLSLGGYSNGLFTFFASYASGADYAFKKYNGRDHWRFEARTDMGSAIGAGVDRVGLYSQLTSSDNSNTIPFDTDLWFSWVMIPSGDFAGSPWAVVGQFHGTQESGEYSASPPLAFEITDGAFKIVTRHDANATQTSGSEYNYQERYSEPYVSNKVYNIVGRARFNYSGNAVLDIWLNGTQVVGLTNISMGYNDTRGPNPALDIYRDAASTGTVVVEYANIEFSYSSLLDRVTNPLPLPR